VTVAVKVPVEAGVNVKVFVQLAPTASGLTQVDAVLVNELALVPVMVVTAVNVTGADVLLVNVMTCAAAVVPTVVEANVSEAGEIVTPVPADTPVPVTATVWGVLEAESVKVMVALNVPAAVGVKVNVFVQLAPTASGFAQVEAVLENELAPVPVMVVVAVKVSGEAVLFLSVMTCAVADVPTVVEGNVSEFGVMVTPVVPPVPVPLRITVCGVVEAESV
jgi:hypothetical protein